MENYLISSCRRSRSNRKISMFQAYTVIKFDLYTPDSTPLTSIAPSRNCLCLIMLTSFTISCFRCLMNSPCAFRLYLACFSDQYCLGVRMHLSLTGIFSVHIFKRNGVHYFPHYRKSHCTQPTCRSTFYLNL